MPYADCKNSNGFLLPKVIDLLFSLNKTDNAIPRVLPVMGNYFKVSRILIMECFSGEKLEKTYEWYLNDAEQDARPLPVIENIEEYACRFNADGIFYTNAGDISEKADYVSLQFAFMNNERCKGFIFLEDFTASRSWNRDDIGSFVCVGKCIDAYLASQYTKQEKDYFANMDGLTNIWNLNKFAAEAFTVLGKIPHELYTLVSLDIKRFRYFNEKRGYEAGNEVLVSLGSRLKEFLDSEELLARSGGAQFIMLLNYTDFESLYKRLQELLKSFDQLKMNNGTICKLTIACGVYIMCGTNMPFSACLDRAIFARSSAKKTYKSTIVFFDEKMEREVLLEKYIEENVESALVHGEFFVLYQPKVRLHSRAVIGAEALIRWQSPEKGLIQPDEFIPVLEKNGFIVEIDLFLLNEVCKKICEWKDRVPDIIMAVNFSRVHMEQKDSLSRALRILKHWEVSPEKIEIEITESAFSGNAEEISMYVKRLQQAGFKVAMDDFGSGYSSLTMLNNLAFDVVKLDRDFLCRKNSVRERIVLDNIIRMAHDLGMSVVAEGVETDEQASLLSSVNCESAQGYLFAKPISVDEFEKLL